MGRVAARHWGHLARRRRLFWPRESNFRLYAGILWRLHGGTTLDLTTAVTYEDTLVKCTPPPTTDAEEERRYIDACVQGEGKKCFQPTPEVQGLKYIGDAFVDSMAFTTWIYIPGNRVRCPDSRKSYPNDNRRNFIFSLEGESAGETYRLQLELADMKKYCKK